MMDHDHESSSTSSHPRAFETSSSDSHALPLDTQRETSSDEIKLPFFLNQARKLFCSATPEKYVTYYKEGEINEIFPEGVPNYLDEQMGLRFSMDSSWDVKEEEVREPKDWKDKHHNAKVQSQLLNNTSESLAQRQGVEYKVTLTHSFSVTWDWNVGLELSASGGLGILAQAGIKFSGALGKTWANTVSREKSFKIGDDVTISTQPNIVTESEVTVTIRAKEVHKKVKGCISGYIIFYNKKKKPTVIVVPIGKVFESLQSHCRASAEKGKKIALSSSDKELLASIKVESSTKISFPGNVTIEVEDIGKIHNKWTQRPLGLDLPCFEKPEEAPGNLSEISAEILRVRKALKDFYRKNCRVELLPSFRENTQPFEIQDELFTITSQPGGNGQVATPTSLEKILTTPGKQLLKGRAGSGKSVLSRALTRCWANSPEEENLIPYHWVFRISLTKLIGLDNWRLSTILANEYSDLGYTSAQWQTFLWKILPSDVPRLFILDDYDEMYDLVVESPGNPGNPRIQESLRELLTREPNILLISRPYKLYELNRIFSFTPGFILKLARFSLSLVMRYIDFFFEGFQTIEGPSVKELTDKLKLKLKNVHKLLELCRIPICLEFLCSIWPATYNEEGQTYTEEVTLFSLYEALITTLFHRYHKKMADSKRITYRGQDDASVLKDSIAIIAFLEYFAYSCYDKNRNSASLSISSQHLSGVSELRDAPSEASEKPSKLVDKLSDTHSYISSLFIPGPGVEINTEVEYLSIIEAIPNSGDADLRSTYRFISEELCDYFLAAFLGNCVMQSFEAEAKGKSHHCHQFYEHKFPGGQLEMKKFLIQVRSYPRYQLTARFLAGYFARRNSHSAIHYFLLDLPTSDDSMGLQSVLSLIQCLDEIWRWLVNNHHRELRDKLIAPILNWITWSCTPGTKLPEAAKNTFQKTLLECNQRMRTDLLQRFIPQIKKTIKTSALSPLNSFEEQLGFTIPSLPPEIAFMIDPPSRDQIDFLITFFQNTLLSNPVLSIPVVYLPTIEKILDSWIMNLLLNPELLIIQDGSSESSNSFEFALQPCSLKDPAEKANFLKWIENYYNNIFLKCCSFSPAVDIPAPVSPRDSGMHRLSLFSVEAISPPEAAAEEKLISSSSSSSIEANDSRHSSLSSIATKKPEPPLSSPDSFHSPDPHLFLISLLPGHEGTNTEENRDGPPEFCGALYSTSSKSS